MIVITEADYSNQRNVIGGNPRTEIIVRQAQPPPPSDWWGGEPENFLPGLSCLSDTPIGLGSSFTTGLNGTATCACVPGTHLNCDGS